MSDDHTITALRAHLFDALRDIKAGALDLDKARAINEVAKTLIDSAKVEVDYIKATNDDASNTGFIAAPEQPLPPGVVRHRLRG